MCTRLLHLSVAPNSVSVRHTEFWDSSSQGYYASMGWGVPAAMGAELATGMRSLLLMGDGAFQMTGSEISHAPKLGIQPIVLLVNNGSWGIFRPVVKRRDLLELPNWPYAEMARGWGGYGRRVTTRLDLREALAEAQASNSFSLIEIMTSPDDLSPVSQAYIRSSVARNANAPGSITNDNGVHNYAGLLPMRQDNVEVKLEH